MGAYAYRRHADLFRWAEGSTGPRARCVWFWSWGGCGIQQPRVDKRRLLHEVVVDLPAEKVLRWLAPGNMAVNSRHWPGDHPRAAIGGEIFRRRRLGQKTVGVDVAQQIGIAELVGIQLGDLLAQVVVVVVVTSLDANLSRHHGVTSQPRSG